MRLIRQRGRRSNRSALRAKGSGGQAWPGGAYGVAPEWAGEAWRSDARGRGSGGCSLWGEGSIPIAVELMLLHAYFPPQRGRAVRLRPHPLRREARPAPAETSELNENENVKRRKESRR